MLKNMQLMIIKYLAFTIIIVSSLFLKTETTAISSNQNVINFEDVFVGQTRLFPVLITNKDVTFLSVDSISVTPGTGLAVRIFKPKKLTKCAADPCPESSVLWFSITYKPASAKVLPGNTAVTIKNEAGQILLRIPVRGRGVALNDTNSIDVTSAPYKMVCNSKVSSASSNREAFQRAADVAGKATPRKYLRIPASACSGDNHFPINGFVRITGPGVVGVPLGNIKPYIKMYGANGGRDADPSPHTIFSFVNWDGKQKAVFANLRLDGGWDGRTDPGLRNGGEWDHIFDIRNSKNVAIENNFMENPWGDCVYVGGGYYPGPTKNILISQNYCVNPFRTAVAFISVDGAKVLHNSFIKQNGGKYRNGLWYHFAVDLEPNAGVVPRETDWNIEVAYNYIRSQVPKSNYEFDVGIGIGLSYASQSIVGGNIDIHDNHGLAPGSFFKPNMQGNGTSQWINSRAYRNSDPFGCWTSGEALPRNCK